MASSSHAEVEIEFQIKKRIVPEALTPNDLDFYVRKVRRLESDNNILQDELNKVRIRLRKAEDFEIKYEVVAGECSSVKKELQIRDKNLRDVKALNEKLTRSIEQRTDKTQEWSTEKRGLLEEIEKWTTKAEESEIRRVTELAGERLRSEETLKKEVAFLKKDFEEKEDEYKFEIRQLKKVILEKETVENIVNNRVEKIRREKDEEIKRLSNVIDDEKETRTRAIEEKNEEISRLKEKFEKMINFELENIKKNLEDQGEVFSIELNGLKEIIAIKNDEITKLLTEIKRQATDHENDRKELQKETTLLKEKIYQVEREGELELYNLRQKLTDIQAADLKELEARYQELIDTLKSDKAEMENFLKEKERLKEEQRKDFERNMHELQDKLKERDQRISHLIERIKQSGDINTGELKDLHSSFHKIEAEKETLTSEYQTNINFMTQQIAKLTASNEVKNSEMKKLYEELHQTKLKFEGEMKEVDQRNKRERKEREEEKERDRREREKFLEDRAALERDFKNAERRLVREKEKEEREKNKLKFIVQELEKDIERLNKYIRQLDDSLKGEYKKSQMAILDGDGSRREVTSQLQKQKVQIETLRSIQLDQIKRKFEIETSRVIQQNEKLKTDLLNKALALQKAQTELKKLDYQNRNMDKINKDKILDYEKKMATLNNEINLTQQLYQTFMQAKARKKQ